MSEKKEKPSAWIVRKANEIHAKAMKAERAALDKTRLRALSDEEWESLLKTPGGELANGQTMMNAVTVAMVEYLDWATEQ